MQKLFGIPMSELAVSLVVVLAVLLAIVAALAVRNVVFLRLGLRSAARRRARTALIVVGLMLATTIVASALATGDTVSRAIRSTALQAMGQVDEAVTVGGAEVATDARLGQSARADFLDLSVLPEIEGALRGTGLADGISPAMLESAAVIDETARQSEPRVTLFALDPARERSFGEIHPVDGGTATFGDLAAGEVYLNDDAAADLDARQGDRVRLFVLGHSGTYTVRAVVRYDGAGTDGAAVLMPLTAAQELTAAPGKASAVVVSNTGGLTSGVALSGEVERALAPVVEPKGLETRLLKQDALEEADAVGSMFMSLFTTFGSFSIVAGILLIFLIFVMLAAERRSELGIARAIGTRRGHLVEMFLFEGVAYDLAAAAVGALVGIGVAFLMVLALAAVLGEAGLDVTFAVTARSVVVAYGIGVLLTLVVVTFSAWRVSRLNITAAVRNLPEPPVRRARWRRIVRAVVVLALGGLLVAAGLSSANGTLFPFGVSVVIVGIVLALRSLGAPERIAFTLGGVALVAWWLLPFDVIERIAGTQLTQSFSVFLIGGVMVVLGAVWTIVYNADLLLGATMVVLGRARGILPVLKLAAAYPIRNRFRTGVTLAMFTLVVFTLVVGSTTTVSFNSAFNDLETFGGGFDVRAASAPGNPIPGMAESVAADRALARDVTVVAGQSYLPVDAKQVDAGGAGFAAYPLRGLDDAFLRRTTFGFATTARGYATSADVWRALRTTPGLAVVDAFVVPRRTNWSFGTGQDFRLQGLYLEDQGFEPVPVDVRDPETGITTRLTVIGVLKDSAPLAMSGISTSQATAASTFGRRAGVTVHYFALRPGADADAVAGRLESRFLEQGLEADSLAQVLSDAVDASLTISYLIEAFMGLGLVVGVAALGVISARAVVERRQQIGVLRAIGFRKGMVQLAFLLESAFVALTAIVVGTMLGLLIARNVIADAAQNPSYDNVHVVVPWLTLGLVFAVVFAVALLATTAAARKAARVVPAEALRYE